MNKYIKLIKLALLQIRKGIITKYNNSYKSEEDVNKLLKEALDKHLGVINRHKGDAGSRPTYRER